MPPKRKSKKRSRPKNDSLPDPVESLDPCRRDEIVMTFQNALQLGETTLSLSGAKRVLKNLGMESKLDEIQSFFEGTGGGAMEYLDEASFLCFAASKTVQVDKAYKAFELMDQDGKGVVVLEDLQRVAQDLGEDMTTEEMEEMIQMADRSGDGLLMAKDFVRLARKVNL